MNDRLRMELYELMVTYGGEVFDVMLEQARTDYSNYLQGCREHNIQHPAQAVPEK